MDKRTILICDPDRELVSELKGHFAQEGYELIAVHNGEEMQETVGKRKVDLIIMETLLPDGDGFEHCRRLRVRSNVPVIFHSSRSQEFDRVLGLKMGADDFLGKPCSLRELSARVEAVLRRAIPMPKANCIKIAELSVYPDAFSAYVAGERVELIPSDFKLLCHLASNAGKVLSREKLLDAVWGLEAYGSQRSIDTQIKRIRKAVSLPNVHFAIRTIYGVGYKLEIEL